MVLSVSYEPGYIPWYCSWNCLNHYAWYLVILCCVQGNSPQARTLAANLSQKLQQLKAKLQDALVGQVADDFMDITTPLKALSDAANAPFGNLIHICSSKYVKCEHHNFVKWRNWELLTHWILRVVTTYLVNIKWHEEINLSSSECWQLQEMVHWSVSYLNVQPLFILLHEILYLSIPITVISPNHSVFFILLIQSRD